MESSSSSSSGSLRRGRALGNGNQVPSCLVDGCTSDLSKCRDYHRRHKVCEIHSKTPKVFIRGLEQRFCQQCSRFHSLVEFDEGKRSCRKRLDGHNRRRRKPQPDSLAVNSARLFSNHQGTQYLQFDGSQVLSTTAASSAWTGAVKAENDIMLYGNQSSLNLSGRKDMFPGILSQSSKRGKQLPFLQGIVSSTLPGDCTVVQPTGIDANSTLAHHSNSGQKMFSDGSSSNRAINSNRALSLLSSPQSETREIGFSQVMVQQQPDLAPSTQPSLVPIGLNFSGIGMESEPIGNVLISDGSSNAAANLHGQEMFQLGPDDGSSATASRSCQTLSFSWE